MNRCLFIVLASTLIGGCVHYGRSSELALMPGVEYSDSGTGLTAISRVTLKLSGVAPDASRLEGCLAENVRSGEADLVDSSRSYVGRYSGIYREVESRRTISGENEIKHVAATGDKAVARGQISYVFNSEAGFVSVPITRILRFTLSVSLSRYGNSYVFKDLETAQTDTGVVSNSGFGPFIDLQPVYPERGYKKLTELSGNINRCLLKG